MKLVAKYNTFKGISTFASIGTPIVTLLSCSEMFIHQPETAISATGIFAILLVILLLKDKIAENLKMPSAFIVSTVVFVLIMLVENLIQPLKIVALATAVTSGIDEVTFKRIYKSIELQLPETAKSYKYCGFLFTTTNKLLGENNDAEQTKQ